MPDLCYLNGEFGPLNEAKISINDRGLLFGDSIYEVVCAYGEKPFLLSEHLTRLQVGLSALEISANNFLRSLPSILDEGLKRAKFQKTLIYIQVTRGVQERQLTYHKQLAPTCIVTFREFLEHSIEEKRKQGVAICLRPDIRWAYCHLKTTNLLANVILRNDAAKNNFFEAALIGNTNAITEGTSSSVFMILNNIIFAPPLTQEILPGVYRDHLQKTLAPQAGITVSEKAFTAEELKVADEVFITSTTIQIMPVVRIEDHIIGTGTPGPITRKLIAALNSIIE